jgi:hypothetical protein
VPAQVERLLAIGFKQVGRPALLLAFQVLGEFPAEATRKQHSAILMAFALGNTDLTGLQIDIGEAGIRKR